MMADHPEDTDINCISGWFIILHYFGITNHILQKRNLS